MMGSLIVTIADLLLGMPVKEFFDIIMISYDKNCWLNGTHSVIMFR